METRQESFCKTSFHFRIDGAEKITETRQRSKNARRLPDISDGAKKGQKQGRDERRHENYRTPAA